MSVLCYAACFYNCGQSWGLVRWAFNLCDQDKFRF